MVLSRAFKSFQAIVKRFFVVAVSVMLVCAKELFLCPPVVASVKKHYCGLDCFCVQKLRVDAYYIST